VWVGHKRVPQDGRNLIFLCSSGEGAAQVSKNFETFAGQIVREFRIDPAEVEFAELRAEGDEQQWYRWHAQWVGSAPMECRAELVTAESSRRYLAEVLSRSVEAA
jgi:hypothetical protein